MEYTNRWRSSLLHHRPRVSPRDNSALKVKRKDPWPSVSLSHVKKSTHLLCVVLEACPSDGIYISLMNTSSKNEVDISKWILKQIIDAKTELRYTLPDRFRLQPGGELRIFSKQGANAAKSSSSGRATPLSSRQELTNNDAATWGTSLSSCSLIFYRSSSLGVGNTIETYLFTPAGDEKASFSQTISAGKTSL